MKYDLWDIGAHYFFDRFASEEEALAYVAALLDESGDAYADDLELVIGEGGERNLSGPALVERVRARGRHPVGAATGCGR